MEILCERAQMNLVNSKRGPKMRFYVREPKWIKSAWEACMRHSLDETPRVDETSPSPSRPPPDETPLFLPLKMGLPSFHSPSKRFPFGSVLTPWPSILGGGGGEGGGDGGGDAGRGGGEGR